MRTLLYIVSAAMLGTLGSVSVAIIYFRDLIYVGNWLGLGSFFWGLVFSCVCFLLRGRLKYPLVWILLLFGFGPISGILTFFVSHPVVPALYDLLLGYEPHLRFHINLEGLQKLRLAIPAVVFGLIDATIILLYISARLGRTQK